MNKSNRFNKQVGVCTAAYRTLIKIDELNALYAELRFTLIGLKEYSDAELVGNQQQRMLDRHRRMMVRKLNRACGFSDLSRPILE